MGPLEQKIEALLYAHGGELSKHELARLLAVDKGALEKHITELSRILSEHGVQIITTTSTVALRTGPEESELLKDIDAATREGVVGQAGLEVLAIILYKEGASRADIDYIRGVNSAHTLRVLSMRGFVTRERHPHDARQWYYHATPELLAHLGVTKHSLLPEYADIHAQLHATTPTETASEDTSNTV